MSTRQELHHEHADVHFHSFMGENTTEIFFFEVHTSQISTMRALTRSPQI